MRNFIITVNGQKYEVGIEETGAAVPSAASTPAAAPAPVAAPVKAAPAPQAAPAAVPAAGKTEDVRMTSPFPGLIKGLLVENGATVKKDQPILVLEAMKMDNDITAPCDGVVTLCVAKGANVETDALLAVIA